MARPTKALVVLTGPAEDGVPQRGSVLPQLMHVANRPVISHVLDQLADAGVEEAALVVAEQSCEDVRAVVQDGSAWGLRARYVLHEERLGPGGAVLAAEDLLEDRPFLLHYGDCVVDGALAPVLERAVRRRLDGLVVVRGHAGRPGDGKAPAGGRLTGPSGLALRMLMEAPVVPALVLSPAVLEHLRGLRPSWRGQIELAAALEAVRRDGGGIELRTLNGWRFSGSVDDRLEGNRALLDRLLTRYAKRAPGDWRVEGRVLVHRSADVDSSLTRGPSIIGAGARVVDSYVGPYSSIGARAVVEGAEVEDLIIGDDAVVAKLGRRLAASIVGPGARLSRDYRVPGALRVHLGERAEVVLS